MLFRSPRVRSVKSGGDGFFFMTSMMNRIYYEKVGLQVRWIPVATLGPTSMPKAIEIMAAADQVAAFRKMEENHGKPWTPSALSNEAAQPAVGAAIRKNGNSSLDKFR